MVFVPPSNPPPRRPKNQKISHRVCQPPENPLPNPSQSHPPNPNQQSSNTPLPKPPPSTKNGNQVVNLIPSMTRLYPLGELISGGIWLHGYGKRRIGWRIGKVGVGCGVGIGEIGIFIGRLFLGVSPFCPFLQCMKCYDSAS